MACKLYQIKINKTQTKQHPQKPGYSEQYIFKLEYDVIKLNLLMI